MSPAEEAAAARTGGVVLDLSDRAKFTLRGPDRVRFLNGQVSQAVRSPADDETRAACLMTAKGKLNALVYFFGTEEALHLDAPASQREDLAARLERYMIADEVELEDVTDRECLFHVFGGETMEVAVPGAILRRSRRFRQPGMDVMTSHSAENVVRASLLTHWPSGSPALAEQLRIEAGIPAWGAELDESTLPVEAGLERDAIDYHKGCYIGQEVISRLKSIGRVNRQLRGLRATEGEEIVAGMELVDSEGGKAGEVTSATYSFALAASIGLGYVKRGVTADTLLARVSGSGADAPAVKVEVRELPFIS